MKTAQQLGSEYTTRNKMLTLLFFWLFYKLMLIHTVEIDTIKIANKS